jgi:cyclitol reductase
LGEIERLVITLTEQLTIPLITQTCFRSVVLTESGPAFREAQPLELPRQESFVVIKPLLVGVCSSDVKEVSGVRLHRHDFGHEIVGVVVHANFKGPLQPGARVVYDPHVKLARNSGFSELVVAASTPEALESAFFRVESALNVDKLVFLEPMACIMHAYGNLRAQTGIGSILSQNAGPNTMSGGRHLSLGIVGAGNAGTLAAFYGKHLGMAVTLINRSQERLSFLQRTGVFAPGEMMLSSNLKKDFFDIVFLATSFLAPEVVESGLNMVKNKGAILLYGGTTPGMAIADVDLDDIRRTERHAGIRWAGKDILLIGTHGALSADFHEAYDAVRKHPESFPFEHLITNRVTLKELPGLLTSMGRNPDHCTGKAVVEF